MVPRDVAAELKKGFSTFAAVDAPKAGTARWLQLLDKAFRPGRGPEGLYEDLRRIGDLLEDRHQCNKHLAALEVEFAERAYEAWYRAWLAPRRLWSFSRPRPSGARLGDAAIERYIRRGTGGDHLRFTQKQSLEQFRSETVKYFGSLQAVLRDKENAHGFNGSSEKRFVGIEHAEWVRPGDTPTILGVAASSHTRRLLLRNGYHWKDPGVGTSHGEFSHRIQWWIILREHETKGPYALLKPPLKRFRQLASEALVTDAYGAPEPTSAWDVLFDCYPSSMGAKGPTSDTFRSPDVLNRYVKDPCSGFPTLACFLRTRDTKRELYTLANQDFERYGRAKFEKILADADLSLDEAPTLEDGTSRLVWQARDPARNPPPRREADRERRGLGGGGGMPSLG